jgi:ADP-ribosylglycohydrolase
MSWKATTNSKGALPESDKRTLAHGAGAALSNSSADEFRDRAMGSLLGLAVGDAVGAAVEFQPPGTFQPLRDMVGGGPFKLKAGEWTDDTSMALCLAESLSERGFFDPVDQLKRYVRWWREGHFSVKGHCFDIGNQVRTALGEFESTGRPFCGPTGPHNAGNGSLMRLCRVVIAYARSPSAAIVYAGESSRTTHGNRECVHACRCFAGLLAGAMRGEAKGKLLGPEYCPVAGLWDVEPLEPKIDAIAGGSFKTRQPPGIKGTGYVVDCLEAALWAFHATDSFEAAVLRAANLGDDADTTAAVCGQIAGAFYGAAAIPDKWLSRLAQRDTIEALAASLLSACPVA